MSDVPQGKVAGAYVITHTATGKIYVGSSGHLAKRYRYHLNDLAANTSNNRLLQAAYNSDPDLTFFFYVTETKEDALDLEQKLLDSFKGVHELLNVGMDVRRSMKGVSMPDSAKEKLRIINTGKKIPPEIVAKVTATRLAKGFRHREQTKELLSKKLTGLKRTPEGLANNRLARLKQSKPVSINGVVYTGVKAAARETKINHGTIRRRLKDEAFPDWFFV